MAKRKGSSALLAALLTVLTVSTTSSVRASPSYQPNSRYTANDLYPSPAELPTASYKSLVVPPPSASTQNFMNDKQPQQQQQLERSPMLKSGPRAVINGNHATYVEPPADFKPIIYEPERQAASDPALVTSASEGFAEHSNQPVPSRLSPAISSQQQSTSRQQQKRQTEAPPTMTLQELPENQIIRAHNNRATSLTDTASADEETNSFPMKPSIDRWSDWTDMSVDPDLASSDTQLSPTSTQFNTKQHKSVVPSRHVSALKWQSSHAQPKQQQQQLDLGVHRQRNHLDLIKTSAQANDRTSSSSKFVPLDAYHRHVQDERVYLAPSSTGNLMKMPHNFGRDYQAAAQLQLVASHGDALSYQPARPIYYILQQQQPHNIQTGPVEEHRFDSFARSSSQGAFVAQTPQHVMMPPLALAPPPLPPAHMPVLLQRYGKKMGNLFRAANNNQYYPMSLAKGGLKRLDGLKPSAVAQQNAEVRQLASSQGQKLSSPLVQLSAGQSSGIDTSAHLGKRVSVGSIPTVNRVIMPAANYAQGQRNQVKQHQHSNSTTMPPKRVLKRRRIKTLVPVGLSSWFLGGIRDLDARHWKLPADVISKLAVNDVDLAHSEQPTPFVGAPASQDELVNMSNQVQAGGSLEKADSPRASTTRSPTSQPLSPR